MEEANIEEIIEVLERIETEDLSEDPDIKGWLEQITKEEFQLIEPFITMFIENIKDEELTDNVIKVLRKLNFYEPDSVLPQILKYKDFPKHLVKYMEHPDIKKLSGSPIGLFNDIYRENLYLDLITKEFLEHFFECFDLLDREADLNRSVQLISHFNRKDHLSKFIMEIFSNHKNASKLVVNLLLLLNKQKEDKDTIYDICKLMSDLMDLTKTSLFYKNDLELFITNCITTLQTTYTNEMRYHYLNILNKIMNFEDYFESKYKIDDLEEILDNYSYNDNVDNECQKLSREIMEKIEKKS